MMWVTSTLRTLANEDIGTLAEYDPLTGYEPNDLHISETENRSLNLHDLDLDDLDLDDFSIGRTLSSPLFTQERENAASRGRAYHSLDEGLSSSQSSSVGHGTGRLVGDQFDSLNQTSQKIRRSSEYEQIRILPERQKEQILADCRAEIQNTNSRPIMTEEVFKS